MKKNLKKLVRENLTKTLYDKNIETLFNNKSKIRTSEVFNKPNPNEPIYNSEYNAILNSVEGKLDNLKNSYKEKVNVEDIAPTQRFISANNMDNVSSIGRDTNGILILIEGVYYIVDGHHRIATRILKGDTYIIAYVIKV